VRRCTSADAPGRRILIARTTANGDILMGTPLLAALRAAWPDVHLTWMVEYREREAIDANPFVDELLLWDTQYWKGPARRGLYPVWLARVLHLRRLMREKRFDTLISFQPEDWTVVARTVGAPVRIGVFDTFREYHRQTRTSRKARLYTRAFAFEEHPPHRVDQYLLPLRELGIPAPLDKQMTMGYTAADEQTAAEYIDRELDGEPFIVVAPLTGWPSRQWPPERFAAAADAITRASGRRVVLVSGGGEQDRAVVEQITGLMETRPHRACGVFGFRGLAALITRADAVVSGDTGPMHVAAAVGTPYVALFGPTPPERFAPQVGPGRTLLHPVPCGPCHQKQCRNTGDDYLRCLRLITVEEVTSAVLGLLGTARNAAARQESLALR
jgi:ADP-heptose:LPS heptosyltransferase